MVCNTIRTYYVFNVANVVDFMRAEIDESGMGDDERSIYKVKHKLNCLFLLLLFFLNGKNVHFEMKNVCRLEKIREMQIVYFFFLAVVFKLADGLVNCCCHMPFNLYSTKVISWSV